MKRIFILFLLGFVLLPSLADAQKRNRFEQQILGGIGVSNFLGDLGGANDIGRDGLADLDFVATRPSLMIGYRYQLNNFIFLRSNLTWGILKGDDANTEQIHRRGRNLSFRSGFLDLNLMAEFYLFNNARGNSGVRGRRGLNMDLYVFAGIGGMYFNPKAEYQGQWVALQPIGTEGQGLPGEEGKYSRFTFTVPYGIGIGKSIDRYWAVNVEFTMRATFTDYIDDVSTEYYGRDNLRQAKLDAGASQAEANTAAFLSDPNIFDQTIDGFNSNNQLVGEQRGDPTDNDAFMTGMITIARKIVKRRRSKTKF